MFLIADPGCPDALVRALLTPWDSLVAGRLVARQRPVPQWAWRAALARIGELRPSFLRRVLSEETVEEMVLTTPRLDMLIRAVDGYDHNHGGQVLVFWSCVGGLLRRRLGDDRARWPAVAASLPSHPGSFASLLRRVTTASAYQADLRVLGQAPGPVLADVIAGLSDAQLDHMETRDLGPRRTRGHLRAMVLDRFVASAVPPRELFARWACGPYSTPATRAWAHGLLPALDHGNERAAIHDVTLRRLLAAGSAPPRDPAADLVSALRTCGSAIEAEALLDRALGQNEAPPWRALLESPMPPHLLGVLAARDGFPEALARALPADLLSRVADQSPAAARAAVTALHRLHNPWGLLYRIRAAGVLDDEELLATGRPAEKILWHAYTLRRQARPAASGTDGGDLVDHYALLVTVAARPAPPRFWRTLQRLLPTFAGTVPELLTAARQPDAHTDR